MSVGGNAAPLAARFRCGVPGPRARLSGSQAPGCHGKQSSWPRPRGSPARKEPPDPPDPLRPRARARACRGLRGGRATSKPRPGLRAHASGWRRRRPRAGRPLRRDGRVSPRRDPAPCPIGAFRRASPSPPKGGSIKGDPASRPPERRFRVTSQSLRSDCFPNPPFWIPPCGAG
jgi:hypothetical protein